MNNVALAVDFLARRIRYDVVAPQDLGYDLARMPTRPRSGFRIENVRTTAALHAPVPWPPGTEAAIEWTTGKRPMHS